MLHSFLGAALVLLDAGADVNGLSTNGWVWPLLADADARSEASMAWLLEHGASATLANIRGRTVVHVLAAAQCDTSADAVAESEEFCCRWLRPVVAAEPSLLEAREGQNHTLLLLAATAGSEACVATLLELGADVGAVGAWGDNSLTRACDVFFLPVVRQLIAAGAASAAALPPGSRQVGTLAAAAEAAA
jgi:ankyrin repeat protein